MGSFLRVTDGSDLDLSKKIEEKIKSSNYDTSYLYKISKTFDANDHESIQDIKALLSLMENKAYINKYRPVMSYDIKYSKFQMLYRKLLNKLLRWYLYSIFDAQKEYNENVLFVLKNLDERIEKIEKANKVE